MGAFDDIDGPVFCINCRKPIRPSQVICPFCGRDQTKRQEPGPPTPLPPMYAPPIPQQPPLSAFLPPPDPELIELATQYKSARSHAIFTFWVGLLLCQAYLWIWTYIARTKMQVIRARVAARGIPVDLWIAQIDGKIR